MLFNSHVFVFAFLPLVLLAHLLLARLPDQRPARALLVAASLFFYAWWNPVYLPLLVASMAINYAFGLLLARRGGRGMLALGVALNLGALGYFKYAHFLAGGLGAIAGERFELAPIVLPLAISFFTFQQIAYLCDVRASGRCERSLLDYAVFVTFFPQLIAGPIVHHAEMLPQFKAQAPRRDRRTDLAVGSAIFFAGLFKKTVVADGLAPYASSVFALADQGSTPLAWEAWAGALAYTFQLYFDFSGYSDMAIGLGRLFGIRLPLNFDSPYRAASVIDFWRRWHMTLSRFLRDYLYIPLGGNRRGSVRRYVNLMITMVLGGLWHGAGLGFVLWGALHGVYLLVNHGFRALRGGGKAQGTALGRWLGRTLTFFAVVVGWVVFRAVTLEGAGRMLRAMFGGSTATAPVALGSEAPLLFVALTVLVVVCMVAPNIQAVAAGLESALSRPREADLVPARLRFALTPRWAAALALVTVWAVLGINQYSEFLYFQF